MLDPRIATTRMFKGVRMECGFRMDLFVEGCVVVEVKCVDRLTPVHTAQVLTYLRLHGPSW